MTEKEKLPTIKEIREANNTVKLSNSDIQNVLFHAELSDIAKYCNNKSEVDTRKKVFFFNVFPIEKRIDMIGEFPGLKRYGRISFNSYDSIMLALQIIKAEKIEDQLINYLIGNLTYG